MNGKSRSYRGPKDTWLIIVRKAGDCKQLDHLSTRQTRSVNSLDPASETIYAERSDPPVPQIAGTSSRSGISHSSVKMYCIRVKLGVLQRGRLN